MKPNKAGFPKAKLCLPQALLSLCSPRRVVDEHGHSLSGCKFWLPHVGLQAYLILASCRTSFKTSVWAVRIGNGIYHFPHSQGNATKQDFAGGKGAFTPMGWDPSLTLQQLSMLQYFLRKRLHPWRLGSSKAHESNFSLFSRHSFLHLCQPRPLASPCPCPRWPKVTQARQAPALQHTHIIRGHPVRSI